MRERYIYNISNIINNYMGIPVEVTLNTQDALPK